MKIKKTVEDEEMAWMLKKRKEDFVKDGQWLLQGIGLTSGIEEGEVVVVRAVIKGEPGAEG